MEILCSQRLLDFIFILFIMWHRNNVNLFFFLYFFETETFFLLYSYTVRVLFNYIFMFVKCMCNGTNFLNINKLGKFVIHFGVFRVSFSQSLSKLCYRFLVGQFQE